MEVHWATQAQAEVVTLAGVVSPVSPNMQCGILLLDSALSAHSKKLPLALVRQFRPIHLVVPDQASFTSVLLAAQGFQNISVPDVYFECLCEQFY
jgi:hypothetical protein